MKIVLLILIASALGACSRMTPPPVASNTSYSIDESFSTEAPSQPLPKTRRVRASREARASLDTTGSVPDLDGGHEDLYLTQILKEKPNSPEWLNLRAKIEDERKARNERENARLTICKHC